MIKSDFTFRRFVDTFVPGFIVVIGLWYLYRPYYAKYFPIIASDYASKESDVYYILDKSYELKLVFVLIASVFAGIIVNHFADIPVACIYKHYDVKSSDRSSKDGY